MLHVELSFTTAPRRFYETASAQIYVDKSPVVFERRIESMREDPSSSSFLNLGKARDTTILVAPINKTKSTSPSQRKRERAQQLEPLLQEAFCVSTSGPLALARPNQTAGKAAA